MIYQNGESASDQEHEKKEVHKMGQPQPCGETLRRRRRFQIERRQESLRWKSGDQILSPRLRANQVALTGRGPERLADGFGGTLREVAVG